MERRHFTKAMGAVVAGMAAGTRAFAEEKKAPAAAEAKDVHVCKGMNECKGMGGCKTGDAGCAGKNSCKGKGGCNVPVTAEEKKDKSSCKGM